MQATERSWSEIARAGAENRSAIRNQASNLSDGIVMLQCGHPAEVRNGKIHFAPSCTACDPGSIVEMPDLAGRFSKCSGCKNKPQTIAPSSLKLPFFRYQKDRPMDEYFCGCWGWS